MRGAIKGTLIALLTVCGGACPVHRLQQVPLGLSTYLGKAEYFEGEPIYAVFRLRNTSTGDTAWVQPFELMPDRLNVILKRSDTSIVPQQILWIDYVAGTEYRGMPVAPGGELYLVVVLQESWGVQAKSAERVFLHGIVPERYTLVARFDPQLPGRQSPGQEAVFAPAVSFTVRPRTGAEEVDFHEVSSVMGLVWDRSQRPQYLEALIALAGRRLATDSMDPYVAYLLNHGVVMAEAAQLRLDSTQNARVMNMRMATAQAQRALPAGALVAEAAFFAARDTGLRLSEMLGASLAGDVVRAAEARYSKAR
ncbi:MAG: hypothetical protein DMD46_04465 [Gemmatimonadetes bacterium]|nr:MAG: hypothetical protein DMD46_04465 [Gemmatimonadota bacterium]